MHLVELYDIEIHRIFMRCQSDQIDDELVKVIQRDGEVIQ